jgi:dTDP-4-amino-4,6-dideoxygalactose transaminase
VKHAWHLYAIRLMPGTLKIDRAQFIDELKARNIGASVHFIPVHLHPFYQQAFGYKAGDYPVAESYFEGAVSLPLYPRMTEADVVSVIEAVQDIIHHHRR